MKTYYATCNVNGPISRAIEAETIGDALDRFAQGDTQQWIDEPATDAEDDLGITADAMDEDGFDDAMEAAGYTMVRDLAEIVTGQGPTTRMAHVVGGWVLYGPR